MKNTNLIFSMLLFTAFSFIANAQPGSIDPSFDPGTGTNNNIGSITMQSDGKIIIGGSFASYNGTARKSIARLNADGSLDNTFDPGTGPDNLVSKSAMQNDKKIIIGGYFTSYNGTARSRIARLSADGSLDNTFDPGTGADFTVNSIAIQSNGKIIIGGQFTSYNGTARKGIARVNADGSLDTTLKPGTGANDAIYTTAIQSDGKIIIVGNFTSYNGTARNRIARLNADGSLDNTFDPGTGADVSIMRSNIQSDGKIIIVGFFTSYNGTARNHIARLNADGSLDNTFDPGTGATGGIYFVTTIAIQSDGKIIIGGDFTSYNGTAINRFARLNADGSLDNTFKPGAGVNNIVSSLTMQSDGKIIVGGNFTSYDGTARNRIARINVAGGTGSNEGNAVQHNFSLYPNPNNGRFIIQPANYSEIQNVEILDLIGNQIYSVSKMEPGYTFDLSEKQPGIYFVKMTDALNQVRITKFLKQ